MRSITLTAIDIGTHSIMGITARKDFKSGVVEILAKSQVYCFGVRNGEVVRPEYVAVALQRIKSELSGQAGIKIKEVLVNVSGSHLFLIPSEGLVSVSRADQKISQDDVSRVLKAAQAVHIPPNKEILKVLPKDYSVDGEKGIKNPVGLSGVRLEAKVSLVGLFTPVLDNLGKAFSEAGILVTDMVPCPLAASRAVLTQEQKELGVAVLDIGAGTTNLAVFEKGDLADFAVFPIGSANITNDIAIGLRTEISTAEQIKCDFATLKLGTLKGKKDVIQIPEKSLNFPKIFLRNIVESRVSEIFNEAEKALKKISKTQLPSGIILTGGGAKLPGIVEFARQKFKLPCRIGQIQEFSDIDDLQFSVCCGLLLYGFDQDSQDSPVEHFSNESVLSKLKRLLRVLMP